MRAACSGSPRRKPVSGVRPASSSASGQARPETLPAADAERAAQALRFEADHFHAALEQADLDLGHLHHLVALDLGLDLAGGKPLDQRHGGDEKPEQGRRWLRPRRRPSSSFGVRLLFGLGGVEGRMLHAGVVDALDGRVFRHVDLEALGVEDLRHQADIGERRPVAVAERAGGGVGERGLEGVEAGLDPMAVPGEALVLLVLLGR